MHDEKGSGQLMANAEKFRAVTKRTSPSYLTFALVFAPPMHKVLGKELQIVLSLDYNPFY